MDPQLQIILDAIQNSANLADPEKEFLVKAITDADKAQNLSQFKLNRLEKDKQTLSVMLEESIEDLEGKSKIIEKANAALQNKNRELEIEAALEKVRSRSLAMHKTDELREVVNVVFEKLVELKIVKEGAASIFIIQEGSNIIEQWAAAPDLLGSASYFTIPFFDQPIHKEFLEAKNSGADFFTKTIAFEEKNRMFKWLFENSDYKYFPDDTKKWLLECESFTRSDAFAKNSSICIPSYTRQSLTENEINILKRFARVFDQAYTRFLDLQKAEAQAKEAQIEAALERVRAKAMAMHSSEDVTSATVIMFSELEKLGIENFRCGINHIKTDKIQEVWSVTNSTDGKTIRSAGSFNIDDHPFWKKMYEAWADKKDFLYDHLAGKEKDDYVKILNATPNYLSQPISDFPDVHFQIYFFGEGSVWAMTLQRPHSEDEKQIMKRFASVFSLTFRRYQDLLKAEAQAREAQIEAGLERVRSRAMAMHNSNDLSATANIVFIELEKLGIQPIRSGFGIISKKEHSAQIYSATTSKDGTQLSLVGEMAFSGHPVFENQYEYWKRKENYYTSLKGKELTSYYKILSAGLHVDLNIDNDDEKEQYGHWIMFSEGFLYAWSEKKFTEEELDILERFKKVIELTFRRYMDLQKAEAQAREAQIEAALERVRAKAMAMRDSNDLSVTASLVFTELRKLGIHSVRSGVALADKESRKGQVYAATSSVDGDSLLLLGWVNYSGHPVLEQQYESWVNQKDFFPILEGEELRSYYATLSPGYVRSDLVTQQGLQEYGYYFMFVEGFLFVWSERKYSEQEVRILERFKSIIELTFRRYFELQKSEANTKEAVKQAALDRVRADIASMRTVADLERITPLIWNELTILGIPFIRCGVFIMDDEQELIHTFLSTPDGKAIAAFHIPYDTPGNIGQVLDHWKHKENYIDHWDEATFKDFAATLVKQGALTTPEQYLKTLPSGGFYLHFLPFLQGMLYVGNTDRLREEEIGMIQSVADAFSTAYARYEDFNKLEAAKQQVEKTLMDLKQAQQQLVQSEKMASLGELTAGIAHEIQNPLNFVNNFSEVNKELISELVEEVDKGNTDEVKLIANDIKENSEKINHHGKRADAIVKGMLQHSRTSSGQKEMTDINVLADEYLRLAYHGFRAKDKSFNAKFETDFDNSIGKISIVPQEIGRVILNLINNAFYAASQPCNLPAVAEGGLLGSDNGKTPTVWVSTKKEGSKVLISVRDNGPGIPEAIREKIFQPFFTTKPTGQGTGLGLSLSYDIIKAHGGDLRVETKEGEGTIFIMQL